MMLTALRYFKGSTHYLNSATKFDELSKYAELRADEEELCLKLQIFFQWLGSVCDAQSAVLRLLTF